MTDVRVTFSADDQATEVARKLLDTMRALEKEQRAQAQATAATAAPARQAATAFRGIQQALVGIKNTSGIDAISRRVSVLAQGLRSASTQAASLAKLTAAESQLQRALKNTNLTLEQRITLERTLKQTQAAIAGGGAVGGLAGGAQAAIAGISKLQGVLGTLGVALSIAQLVQFSKAIIDTADDLNDLSTKTGVSTESLSVFQQVAEKSGATTETLETGFRQLSRTVTLLRENNQEAVATFAALGLSAKDLQGLSLDQIFIKIADAQAKFADGAGKVAVATRIFGKAGDELIPTLQELANGGFEEARKKAAALGGVLSGETARAADAFNDSMQDAKTAVSGLARAGLSELLPPLTKFIEKITALVVAIQKLRQESPGFLRNFTRSVIEAAKPTQGLSGILSDDIPLSANTFGGKVLEIAQRLIGLKNAADGASTSFKRFGPTLTQLNSGRKPPPEITIVDPALAKAARQAELAAERQNIKDLLAVFQSGARQREQIEDAAFAANERSIDDHFARRLAIVKDGTATELGALDAELSALRASPLSENTDAARTQREAEINGLFEQRKKIEIDGETQVLALIAQQTAARKAGAQAVAELLAQSLRQQGQEFAASQIEIQQAATRLTDTLKAQGFADGFVEAFRTGFVELQTNLAQFQAQQRAAQLELSQLARDRAAIEQQAAGGLISEREAQLQIIQLERQRLPALQQAATAMAAFAEKVRDPALREAAAELQASLGGLGVQIDVAQVSLANFTTDLLAASKSTFADFLGSGINRARNGLEALVTLAQSLAETFQRVAANVLTEQLFGKIQGAFGGAGLATGAAAVTASATALGTSATALTAGATAAGAAGGTITAGASALTGSAAALGGSGGVLITAAAQLNAAAIALAAAMAAGGPVGFATGGYVRGPGTATSDSIPARLSAGEYVIRAAAVRQVGVEYLDALNGLRTPIVRSVDSVGVPRFAEGGLVVAPAASGGTATVDGDIRLAVEHSPEVVFRVLDTPAGVRVLTRIVERHAPAFRKVLG